MSENKVELDGEQYLSMNAEGFNDMASRLAGDGVMDYTHYRTPKLEVQTDEGAVVIEPDDGDLKITQGDD